MSVESRTGGSCGAGCNLTNAHSVIWYPSNASAPRAAPAWRGWNAPCPTSPAGHLERQWLIDDGASNSYRALRVINATVNLMYAEFVGFGVWAWDGVVEPNFCKRLRLLLSLESAIVSSPSCGPCLRAQIKCTTFSKTHTRSAMSIMRRRRLRWTSFTVGLRRRTRVERRAARIPIASEEDVLTCGTVGNASGFIKCTKF